MNLGKYKNLKTPQSVTTGAVKVDDFSQEKGFVGTIIFHALLFLCVFLVVLLTHQSMCRPLPQRCGSFF